MGLKTTMPLRALGAFFALSVLDLLPSHFTGLTQRTQSKHGVHGGGGRYQAPSIRSAADFLCLGGLLRLLRMVRPGGGMPTPRRARRRASLVTLRRGIFLRGMVDSREEARRGAGQPPSGTTPPPRLYYGQAISVKRQEHPLVSRKCPPNLAAGEGAARSAPTANYQWDAAPG